MARIRRLRGPHGGPPPSHQPADGCYLGGQAVPPRGLGIRGEGRRLARARLQGRRWGPPGESAGPGSHAAVPGARRGSGALEVPTLLLDGEIAVFDRQLLSRSEWLRGRPAEEPATPPTLIACDCLYARGKDLRKRPLRVRRNVLEELVDDQRLILPARRLAPDGFEAWAQVLERGYEGLVGKDEASPYRKGADARLA
jgi:hypothetical protein